MNTKIFDDLFMSGLSNDSAFPYWIYHMEHVGVDNMHYLKVYLFNRLFDGSTLDVITLEYNGKEYRSLSFSTVSEYNDPQIIGCVIDVPDYDPTVNVTIKGEVVNRKAIEPAGDNVRYVKPSFPKEDDYYKQVFPKYQSRIVFPQVREKYWQCACGRIHSPEELTCVCDRTKQDNELIVSFDVTEGRIQDYLKVPVNYDLNVSFEGNIEKYKQGITRFNIDPAKLDDRIDLEAESAKYTELYNAKLESEARKKKNIKRTLLAIAAVIILALAGYAGKTYVYPAIMYSQAEKAFSQGDYEKSIATFESLGEFKDSAERIKEVKLAEANYLLDQDEYDKGIEILKELLNIKYIEDLTVNEAIVRKAQYMFDNGNFKGAAEVLKDPRGKGDAWNNLWSESSYQYALELENDHKYEEAINLFYDIKSYKDSQSRRDNLCHVYSDELFKEGKYISAKDFLLKASDVDKTSEVYKETLYQAGLQALKNGNYSGAMGSFNLITGYKDANFQLNETKYQYIVKHKNNTDNSTYKYLNELRKIGYKDTAAIYNSLYQWKVTNVYFNSSKSDSATTSMSSISKYSTVVCHYSISGGPPNGTIKLNRKIVYPDGSSRTETDSYSRGREKSYFYWDNGIWLYPANAPAGYLTVYFYDTSWNLVGSGSVYIK